METSPPSWSCRQRSLCSSRVPSLPQPNSSSNSYNNNNNNNIINNRSSYNSRNSNWPLTGQIVCLIALLRSHSSWLKPIRSRVSPKPGVGVLVTGVQRGVLLKVQHWDRASEAENWLDGQAGASPPHKDLLLFALNSWALSATEKPGLGPLWLR